MVVWRSIMISSNMFSAWLSGADDEFHPGVHRNICIGILSKWYFHVELERKREIGIMSLIFSIDHQNTFVLLWGIYKCPVTSIFKN